MLDGETKSITPEGSRESRNQPRPVSLSVSRVAVPLCQLSNRGKTPSSFRRALHDAASLSFRRTDGYGWPCTISSRTKIRRNREWGKVTIWKLEKQTRPYEKRRGCSLIQRVHKRAGFSEKSHSLVARIVQTRN